MVETLRCVMDIVLRVPTKPPPHKAHSDKRHDKTDEREEKHKIDLLLKNDFKALPSCF